MSRLQHRLSEFLELELHHSLGAYRRTGDGLHGLTKRIEEDRQLTGSAHGAYLADLAQIMRDYNHALDAHHDAEQVAAAAGANGRDAEFRHPAPEGLPLSRRADFVDPASETPDATSGQALTWITAFYDAADHALHRGADPDAPPAVVALYRALLVQRADLNESRIELGREDALQRSERRLRRCAERRAAAVACGIPDRTFARAGDAAAPEGTALATVRTIVASHLEADHRRPLAAFVVRALVDAHLALHEVEWFTSAPLGRRLKRGPEEWRKVERVLDRSIALNTFVWAVARTAPWIFAEDDRERSYMIDFYGRVWRHNMPMRAMWISAQTSLLALHRRAFAHSLRGDKTAAYKDFHKLQRHVRDTARRLRGASVQVDGALDFLDGLDALADHHVGELYRKDRDHTSALVHFNRAHHRLERLKRAHTEEVVVNSRWYVQLQFSLGKACYELGHHKACLAWYLRTWRSLLDLIAADTEGRVNPHALDDVLDWLDQVVDEPELHKRDLVTHLEPVVTQLEAFRVDPRFTVLAGDVLLRLGHLLFVLNLGEQRLVDPARERRDAAAAETEDRHARPDTYGVDHSSLALRCIRRALQLDRNSTLAITDTLKLHHRATRDGREAPEQLQEEVARARAAVKDQWPGGTTTTQSILRAIEYVLQTQLHVTPVRDDEDETIARELLHSMLMHTDSIEAQRSQVHEYLARPPAPSGVPAEHPAIEFVSLRRYSSAFPILPRPQAFRAHGGGYFVRLHPDGGPGGAYGIAIDPGNSYVECLYRSGYALSDIDMIVVTHDHVDHASSLEPLLALRHEASGLDGRGAKPLTVLGNKSVLERWSTIATYRAIDFVALDGPRRRIARLGRDVTKSVRALREHSLATVELRPLSSELPGTAGHRDLMGNPAYGLMISVGVGDDAAGRRTLALTGDLPNIPDGVAWPPPWREALAADVFVCHVSTVPLAELRQMARLKLSGDRSLGRDVRWINRTVARDPDLGSRLAYASWLNGADRTEVDPVGDVKRLEAWQLPRHHPYLSGLLRIARGFRDARPGDAEPGRRLFVVGELSEELGSFRSKLSLQLNLRTFRDADCRSVTGDLGLHVLLTCAVEPAWDSEPVRVLCSTCDLDNDRSAAERFHAPNRIFEVCVKGENEGIFYYCADHDPAGQPNDPTFVEKHERYDVFGR